MVKEIEEYPQKQVSVMEDVALKEVNFKENELKVHFHNSFS